MGKYVLTFSKKGYIRYTSHLDMMRLFRRSFKRAGMDLLYSNGYNPHPKMSMALPLSLGYTSECEILELETKEDHDPQRITETLQGLMPEGLTIVSCEEWDGNKKTIASRVYACAYDIWIPVKGDPELADSLLGLEETIRQADQIISLKKQKKTKKLKEIDIKGKIRNVLVQLVDDKILLRTILDAGSTSNLAPEVFLKGIARLLGVELSSEYIEISRQEIFY